MSHIFILLDWTLLAAGLAVTVAGFVFGAFFAWITRLGRPQIIAVSLETAMQNANIAFVLLKTTLPTPYSDIAALPAIAQILMTTSILFIFFGIIMAYKCAQKNKNKETEKVEEEEETTKSLMLKDYADGNNGINARGIETPPPQYYGGQVPPEFSWAKRPSLIVPSSPTIDPRITA
jgi:large-conductance mechanosensitive channel